MTQEERNNEGEASAASGLRLSAFFWSGVVAVALAAWMALFEIGASLPAFLAKGNSFNEVQKLLEPRASREALLGTAALGALLWILAAAVVFTFSRKQKKSKEAGPYYTLVLMLTCLVLFAGWFHAREIFASNLLRYAVFLFGAGLFVAGQWFFYVLRPRRIHPLNSLFWEAAWIVAAMSFISSLPVSGEGEGAFFGYVLHIGAALAALGLFFLCRKAGEKILDDAGWVRAFQSSGTAATGLLIVMAALGGSHSMPPEARYPELSKKGGSGPNLVFIVLDTVRADRLSLYGHQRDTTPFLDLVAEKGVLFKRAYTPSPWTLPSHASMFTGRYPVEHNCVHGSLWLDERFETLAEKLSAKGYVNLAFSANPWISSFTNLDQGFHVLRHAEVLFHEEPRFSGQAVARPAKALVGASGPADSGAQEGIRVSKHWLKSAARDDRPFFLFLNFMEAHLPYPHEEGAYYFFMDPARARQELNKMEFNWLAYDAGLRDLGASDKEKLRMWYDGSIHYLDRRLEELFRELRMQGLREDTLVVVVSDHGENIGFHNLWGHEFSMYHGLLHVPLIISFPGRVPNGYEVNEPYSLERLPALLMSLLEGDEFPRFDEESGEDGPLYASRNRPHRFMERVESYFPDYDPARFDRDQLSVIDWPYHFIWDSAGGHELYRVDRDPHEEDDLANEMPQLADMLENKAIRFADQHPPLYPEGGQPAYDPRTEEQLRSLGYIK